MARAVVRYAVSAGAIVESDVEASGHQAVTTYQEDIGKTVGGSGETVINSSSDTMTVTGYAGEHPTYRDATTSDLSIDTTNTKFVYIKHTGYTYDTTTDGLGVKTTATLQVKVGSDVIAVLEPGAALVLPQYGPSEIKVAASSGTIAVEYFTIAS